MACLKPRPKACPKRRSDAGAPHAPRSCNRCFQTQWRDEVARRSDAGKPAIHAAGRFCHIRSSRRWRSGLCTQTTALDGGFERHWRTTCPVPKRRHA